MRFYTSQHGFYCGVDLHARTMYVCVLDQAGFQDWRRFPGVGNFLSYSRLVRGSRESAGKKGKSGGAKMDNVHLKWAFSEATALFLRGNPQGRKFFARLERKHGKGKAMGVLAARLGRAVYFMLKRHEPFDLKRFVAA